MFHQTSIISVIVTFMLFSIDNGSCTYPNSHNISIDASFSNAIATWYDDPNGPGTGGACGYGGANEVANAPYFGLTAAGNNNLFKSGKGCGACYQVKCTDKPECSKKPIKITITNECPGACNNEAFHFDLSGKAFGRLAKPGQEDKLQNHGRINIGFQRVPCYYKERKITFKVGPGSNKYYLALVVEDVNGDGDLARVELLPSSPCNWLSMKQSWGATWAVNLPSSAKGPYSVRLTTIESRKTVTATKVIPHNWHRGAYYVSSVNF